MGELPAARVTPSRPFLVCGVDYAGPVQIKANRFRNSKSSKAYIAVFVCFSTRAIHLELVSGLSSQDFIAAFRRFISRRGKCTDIYSDCGTNFVGANRELKQLLSQVQAPSHRLLLNQEFAIEGINWHFSPPSAPHFGGLWEAGVKSVKHHLRRILGESRLTFEEFYTTLCQIEACLNSRPLTAMSSDPSDLSALTPGHFLIGSAMTSIPEPNLDHAPVNRLDHYQRLQQLVQHFWKRWSTEYLARLQQRPKWCHRQHSPQIGDLVLVRDDDLPPTKWRLGRIVKTHPGRDSLVRVVSLKTVNGLVKRPITKISLLPFKDS